MPGLPVWLTRFHVSSGDLLLRYHSESNRTDGFPNRQYFFPPLKQKELRRQKVAKRNFHYNILGGPSYTPDFGVLIGGTALMTFRMDPKDTTMQRSVIPASMAFMFTGGLNIMVKPQLFFKNDRFRIFGQFIYKNTQENYYGVGYDTNKNYERGKQPANINIAVCRSTPGSCSDSKKAISF